MQSKSTWRLFAGLLLSAIIVCLPAIAVADSATTFTSGIVTINQQTGDVGVEVLRGGVLRTTNGNALLRSGQIVPGQWVDVKITYDNGDKRHKHRGHVTILK